MTAFRLKAHQKVAAQEMHQHLIFQLSRTESGVYCRHRAGAAREGFAGAAFPHAKVDLIRPDHLMAFLIVGGLFLSYGVLYNHIIDRERSATGTVYMYIHIVLVIALNNITVALEFMREPEVADTAKNIFLVASFLAYYIFLFFIGYFAHEGYRAGIGYFAKLAALSAVFALIMALCYRNSWLSIAVSVLYVYAMFGMIVWRWKTVEKQVKR